MNNRATKKYNPNRVNALDSALSYIILLVVFTLFPIAVRYTIGNVLKKIYLFDTYAYLLISLVLSQGMILIVAKLFCEVRHINPFSGAGYIAKWEGIQVLMSVMLIMGIMLTFLYLHYQFVYDTSDFFGMSNDLEIHESIISIPCVLLYFILSAVLPAIIEEMMFRGIIMRGLEQFGTFFAVVCSSVMFAFMHGNFGQVILQFIGGLAIGSVVIITKNCLLGSIMHAFNNLFSVVCSLLMGNATKNNIGTLSPSVFGSLTDAFSIIFGIIFLVISITYFCSYIISQVKNKAINKPHIKSPYEKNISYVEKNVITDYIIEKDYREVPEMLYGDQVDARQFLIDDRFRYLNKKSNPIISYFLLSVGIIFAVILIFIEPFV